MDKNIETAPSKLLPHTSGLYTLIKGVKQKQRGRAAFFKLKIKIVKRNVYSF
jgi:hypothetical protein